MVRYNAIRTVKPTAEQRTLLAGRRCPALHTARNWMRRIASDYHCKGCTVPRDGGTEQEPRSVIRSETMESPFTFGPAPEDRTSTPGVPPRYVPPPVVVVCNACNSSRIEGPACPQRRWRNK